MNIASAESSGGGGSAGTVAAMTAAEDRAAAALAKVTAELPSGEARPGQVEMARATATAIEAGKHLIVQAGTGTGKTLAYLVPAIVSGRKTIVSTATKSLQDQLASKDLPFLTEHLDVPFTWAIQKGRSNYLCRQRLKEIDDDQQLDLGDDVGKVNAEVERLAGWSKTTLSGERSELDFEPSIAAWAKVSVSSMECPGAAKCPSGGNCFAEQARNAAAEADVAVVNTHLYGTNIAAGGAILPEHDVVVIDEAHRFEEVVSATVGVTLTVGRFANLARAIGAIVADDDLGPDLVANGVRFGEAIEPYREQRLKRIDDEIGQVIALTRIRLERATSALAQIDSTDEDVISRKARASKLLGHMAGDLDVVLAIPETDVAWVEGTRSNPTLRVAPVDVAEVLRDRLWGTVTGVLTSATISPLLGQRLGLTPDEHTAIDVGSQFDYEHQALLYCAADLPEPRSEAFTAAVHDELEALINAAGGRTLALFTSHRALTAAVEALRDRVEHPVLAQGDLPKPLLIETFAEDDAACLFATMGFWEGLDVPGPSLSLVTIDKLPFPRPDDPLLQAKRELARQDAFSSVDLPRAATLLAQGVGRLIRTADDKGVVAVFDRRLAKANYRWEIVNSLPPMRRTRHRSEAEEFLRSLAAEA